MEEIMKACHKEWAVKQTSNEYMVGVQRKFQTNPDGTQHATMLMPAYVDRIVALCHDHLIKAGWTNGFIPTVPFPKEQLILHDPNGEVTDREANTVLERGFNTVKGLTITANPRVHRLLTFDARGRFFLSISWEVLRMAP